MTNNSQNWETQEVIRWLINDELCYRETLGQSADFIENYVVRQHSASTGLYESFASDPFSSFDNVDWLEVQSSCST
jgi:hypothetical protein